MSYLSPLRHRRASRSRDRDATLAHRPASALLPALTINHAPAIAAPSSNDPAPTSVARKQATTLDGLSVTGSTIAQASTATQLDMPIRETPQAISVIPLEWLDEQRAMRLGEALHNDAGVSQASVCGCFDSFRLRGFNASRPGTGNRLAGRRVPAHRRPRLDEGRNHPRPCAAAVQRHF